jgi:hypothetical protein
LLHGLTGSVVKKQISMSYVCAAVGIIASGGGSEQNLEASYFSSIAGCPALAQHSYSGV